MFENLPPYVDDPILGLFQTYQKDPRPNKVNLGIGIYCDDQGKVPLLQSVRAARTAYLNADTPSVYLPTEGTEAYRQAVSRLVFGDVDARTAADLSIVQAVAGTGGLKIGADFLKGTLQTAAVWIPDPSWPNHAPIFRASGFEVSSYPYYDAASGGFNVDGAVDTLSRLPAGSVVVLHPCCQNPTGVDPSQAQWGALLDVIGKNGLLPFFDMAYQGFAIGVDEDAWAIRECVRRGIPCLVASSFSKIFSLYGERVGALSVYAPGADTGRLLGQLKVTIRRTYSNPPALGATLVQTILDDAALNTQWRSELGAMRSRMQEVRATLHQRLSKALPDRRFDYLVEQHGMFSYTGLLPAQIEELKARFGVYVVSSGRICVAGVNSSNINHVCESVVEVSRA